MVTTRAAVPGGRWLKVVVAKEAMSVTIADITFAQIEYDSEADVLYLHVGAPVYRDRIRWAPEGYALRFDAEGNPDESGVDCSPWVTTLAILFSIGMPQIIRLSSAAQ
jgi:hypothetical protein